MSIAVVGYIVKVRAIGDAYTSLEKAINIQSINIDTYTSKYGVAAALLAERKNIIDYFANKADPKGVLSTITRSTQLTGAKNIWLVDLDGDVLVSTNEDILNLNVKNKKYFQAGGEGRLGRETIAQGVKARSYIFASSVFYKTKVIGMVVIEINLDWLEQNWAVELGPLMAITDESIFLSNVHKWRFKKIADSKSKLPVEEILFYKKDSKAPIIFIEGEEYLIQEKYSPLVEWSLLLLKPYAPIKDDIKFAILTWTLLLLFAWLIYWVIYQNNRRGEEKSRQQIEFSNLLEKKVDKRTEELIDTNIILELEIDERKRAEQDLRKAQDELIQAAKMALIGQMSTELAHEYNQPISAIKFYAENVDALMQSEQYDDVKDNMARISLLTERMSKLTSTLRTFAHKPGEKLKRVNLVSVIDEVIVLMQPRSQKEQVQLELIAGSEDVHVKAGHTRLVQVISNIVTNAFDALKETDNKKIEIHWKAENGNAEIRIKDTGLGIDDNIKEKVFDAFYSTKDSGNGLGLGLFIVSNIVKDFSGKLELVDEQGYGTVFLIRIPLDSNLAFDKTSKTSE